MPPKSKRVKSLLQAAKRAREAKRPRLEAGVTTVPHTTNSSLSKEILSTQLNRSSSQEFNGLEITGKTQGVSELCMIYRFRKLIPWCTVQTHLGFNRCELGRTHNDTLFDFTLAKLWCNVFSIH